MTPEPLDGRARMHEAALPWEGVPLRTITDGASLVVIPATVSLVCCDLDGTLIHSYMEDKDKDYHAVIALAGRSEILSLLRASGVRLAVVTNQAGIGYGYNTEEDFWTKAHSALLALCLPHDTPIAVSFAAPKSRNTYYSDPRQVSRRKPSGAMIHEAMRACGLDPRSCEDRASTMMVGDREEDIGAAGDARVYYQTVDRMFHHGQLQHALDDLVDEALSY